jgi:Bacterial Ig-like domain (group 3)
MAPSWLNRMWNNQPWPVRRSGRQQYYRPRPTRPRVETLEDRKVPTVSFFGGNVLSHVQAQALFLGREFSSAPVNTETATLDASLKDVTSGPYLQALARAGYNVGPGSATAGAVDNTSLAVGSTISDAFIRARLQADVSSGLLQAPNANTLYVVYVQPDVAVNLGGGQGTTQQGILGYHTAFVGANGAPIRYAVVVSPGGAAGNSVLPEATTAIDQLTAVTSHELAEAVTDPDVNSNVNNGRLGWFDPQRGEIGDVEENNPNAFVRLNGRLVQEVADQNDQLLSIFAPPPPPNGLIATTTRLLGRVNSTSPFSPPTVTFTAIISPASGAVAPGGRVNLVVNGQVLGSATVQVINGVAEATFTVAFFGRGSFTFDAQYLGSPQFQGSTSNALTVNVF